MPAEPPAAYNLAYHLARFHRVGRRYRRAIRLHQEALAQREQSLGRDHPDTLRSLTGLANSYYAAGCYDQALALFQETLARRERTLGPGQFRQLLPGHGQLLRRRPLPPGNPGGPGAGIGR